MQTRTERGGRVAAIGAAGGALWIAGGLLGGATSRWQPAANILVIVALPLLLAALLGLASQLRARLQGASATWVRGLAWAGAGLAASARIIDLAAHTVGSTTAAAAPLFGMGMFLLSAALIVLGSGALQSAKEPGWEGLLLLVGLTGLFLPVGAGIAGTAGLVAWAIWGTGWIWIGNVLWQTRAATRSRATIDPLPTWRDTARGE